MQCYTSILKTAGLLCLGVLMLGISWFCTTIPGFKAQIAGWVGLVFFGLCFVVIVVQLFRAGPSVIVDESGIIALRSSNEMIEWDDVVSLWIGSVN